MSELGLTLAERERLLAVGTVEEVEGAIGAMKERGRHARDQARELVRRADATSDGWGESTDAARAFTLRQEARSLRDAALDTRSDRLALDHRLYELRQEATEAREAAREAEATEARERRDRLAARQPSLWEAGS